MGYVVKVTIVVAGGLIVFLLTSGRPAISYQLHTPAVPLDGSDDAIQFLWVKNCGNAVGEDVDISVVDPHIEISEIYASGCRTPKLERRPDGVVEQIKYNDIVQRGDLELFFRLAGGQMLRGESIQIVAKSGVVPRRATTYPCPLMPRLLGNPLTWVLVIAMCSLALLSYATLMTRRTLRKLLP